MHEGAIELIARGVLIGPHGILLCRRANSDFTFLPGGHIHFGESAVAVIVRETKEEVGQKVEVSEYFGALEHMYQVERETRHELNLVFLLSGPSLERRSRVQSLDQGKEFVWCPVNGLSEANLMPKALRLLVPQWTRGKSIPWSSDL